MLEAKLTQSHGAQQQVCIDLNGRKYLAAHEQTLIGHITMPDSPSFITQRQYIFSNTPYILVLRKR